LAGLGSAFAQSDYHLDADPARALYRSSVWAHGYIHGYESGFHYGNFDLQITGSARGEKQMKTCRNSRHHYQKSFGSRSSFEAGFAEGFKAGYADGVTGETFRAAEQARSLVPNDQQQFAQRPVDEGISNGYLQGRTEGLSDARLDAAFTPGKALCPARADQAPGYCDFYALGFRWGYNDGYHNQRPDQQTSSALRRP
jgi:hypothetical protein